MLRTLLSEDGASSTSRIVWASSTSRFRVALVPLCKGGRPCPPRSPCHSEPVRALAWESVSPCLPLRGRWQRVALTEGAISHGNSSPPVACADGPLLPAGALQRGAAALTGRRTPRAFVPLRSTAGRRPLRAVQRTCPVERLALRPPFIRRRFRLPCSGAKHPSRYAVRPPALS